MYRWRNPLTNEPSSIKAVIVAILAALISTGVIDVSAEAVAQWGVALELVLGIFYVRQLSTPIAPLEAWQRELDRKATGKPKAK